MKYHWDWEEAIFVHLHCNLIRNIVNKKRFKKINENKSTTKKCY